MSIWKDFFDLFGHTNHTKTSNGPGNIMFNFVNRYLEPLDGVKYKITFDDQEKNGTTTVSEHSVQIAPTKVKPVNVYVWSKRHKRFKLIDTVVPKIGEAQLVNERMKTFKHDSQTHPHPTKPSSPTSHPNPAQNPRPNSTRPASFPIPAPGQSPSNNQGVNPQQIPNSKGEPQHQTDRPIPDKITVIQLKKIFPAANEDYLKNVADELNTDLSKYKLDTVLRRAHFFAQVREEAGAKLKANEESLNYKVEGLSIFRYYKIHPDEAHKDGRIDNPHNRKKPRQVANQEAIANKAYGDREGNGPVSSGDGWRYRGRGIFQLTFKNNYSALESDYSKYWTDASPDFVTHPEKVKEFPYNIRSAVWYWLSNEIYIIADKGSTNEDVEKVTVKINTAKHHLSSRQSNFKDLTYPAFK